MKNVNQRMLRIIHEYPSMIGYQTSFNFLGKRNLLDDSLIILYTDYLSYFKFMEFIKWLSPMQIRPNCLIIYFTEDPASENEVKLILEVAWKYKFLDFTVLVPNHEKTLNGSSSTIFYLNPFENIVYKKPFSHQVKIFPDKLKNGHRYPITIFDNPNSKPLVSQKKHGKVEIIGHENMIADLVFQSLNFAVSKKTFTGYFTPNENAYKTFGASMSAIPVLSLDGWYNEQPSSSIFSDQTSIVVVVPILSNKKSAMIPFIVVMQTIFLFVVTKFFIWIVERLKIASERMKGFDIVRLILGQGVTKEPKTSISRILFLTVTLIFVIYLSVFYTKIVEENFDDTEVPFESFEDLDKSGLHMETVYGFLTHKILNRSEDEYLKNMINKTHVLRDMKELKNCLNNLVRIKNVMCVMDNVHVEMILNNGENSKFMNIAKPPLLITSAFFEFEFNSPYAEKFYKVYQRIYESGIGNTINFLDVSFITRKFIEVDKKVENSFDKNRLLTITFFGCFTSVFTFLIVELLKFDVENLKRILRGFTSFFIIIIYTRVLMK